MKVLLFFFFFFHHEQTLFTYLKIPGPGCSNLTTSLVKDSLNFQKLISQKCQYFLLKKCEKLLHCKSSAPVFNKKFHFFFFLL